MDNDELALITCMLGNDEGESSSGWRRKRRVKRKPTMVDNRNGGVIGIIMLLGIGVWLAVHIEEHPVAFAFFLLLVVAGIAICISSIRYYNGKIRRRRQTITKGK